MLVDDWDPIRLADNIATRIDSYLPALHEHLNYDAMARAEECLNRLVSQVAANILDREGVPHIAHLICGWGNSTCRGRALLDHISDFLVEGQFGLGIPQSDPIGDFHPWQLFAYIALAEPQLLQQQPHLLEIIAASRNLNTCDATDLGHFLLTLGHLPVESQPRTVIFAHREIAPNDLIAVAIRGHIEGGFHVCRKFHLTEGLCLATRTLGLSEYDGITTKFLTGQLRCLNAIWAIVTIITSSMRTGRHSMEDANILAALRRAYVLGEAIENIYYYAGHLIELAGVAMRAGYAAPQEFRSLIVSTTNELNWLLPIIARRLQIAESFYAFAHYRRGCRLFFTTDIDCVFSDSIDCDHLITSPMSREPHKNMPPLDLFCFASGKLTPSIRLTAILGAYDARCKKGFESRGEFPHFRKILPTLLPKGLHYEFLETADGVGVELHCERQHLADHRLFRDLVAQVREGGLTCAIFDPHWHKGSGRLLLEYRNEAQVEEIATAMVLLIDLTYDAIVERYNRQPQSTLGERAPR